MVEVQPRIILDGATKKAVALPTVCDNNFNSSTIFTVSGWGRLGTYRRKPDKLHYVQVPWVPKHICKSNSLYQSSISSRMLCTGNFTYGGVDACAGDSGGRYDLENNY